MHVTIFTEIPNITEYPYSIITLGFYRLQIFFRCFKLVLNSHRWNWVNGCSEVSGVTVLSSLFKVRAINILLWS